LASDWAGHLYIQGPSTGSQAQAHEKAEPPVESRPTGFRASGNDRATRLADVVLAWNIFQHFYPYFDVVTADWPNELRQALAQAAKDTDERAFLQTLRRLVGALHDGHGGVYGSAAPDTSAFPPFGWDWAEGHLLITGVVAVDAAGIKPGDVVVKIDGKPAAEVLTEHESLISGATTQWRRYRALAAVAAGSRDSEITLEILPAAAKPATSRLTRVVHVRRTLDPAAFVTLREPCPEPITTIKPGLIYVDLSRIAQTEFDSGDHRTLQAGRYCGGSNRGHERGCESIHAAGRL
jgi:hypothetical protein